MRTCPQCKAELSPPDLAACRCAACGHALGMPTTDTSRLPPAATVEFDLDGSVDEPAAGDSQLAPKHVETLPDPRVHQVLKEARPVTPLDDTERRTPSGLRVIPLDQTYDVDQGPDDHATRRDVERQVSAVWGPALPTNQNPRMTLKAAERNVDQPNQTLVIKPRVMREVEALSSVPADYELLEVLGEGGMGVVYAARQTSIDRTVALKMLKPNMAGNRTQRDKFLSEAVVTGDLNHPNIVPMYDLGANDSGALFYAMKCVEGISWSRVIHRRTVHENLDILLKVADAVAFAHSRGVVHRDLKPENVMLGDFGEVLVMDWGLAYASPSFRKSGSIMQTHSMGGTPAYMAPEMAVGPIDRVTPASDIYLLGAILYEIVAGFPPHTGSSITACLNAAARNDILPTDKSGELIDIARQAMATRPEDRHASVLALQASIREYLSHAESIAMSARAEQDLKLAAKAGDYQIFSRALFALEEALALWDGNPRARKYISRAQLEYATCALDKGDFDLAASLLAADDPAHEELAGRIAAAKREREARQYRLKNAKRMAAGLAAAVVVVIGVAYFGIRVERDRALSAEQTARTAEKTARTAETEANHQRERAEDAQEAEIYQAYIARIGLADAKIEENAFDAAVTLLDNDCPVGLRHWEWGRLRYLCSQSELTLDAGAPVSSVAYDSTGRRAASGNWSGKVQIWNLATGALEREMDYGAPYVHAVAFSPSDEQVAAAGSDAAAGIKLWDIASGRLLRTFKGHSDSVLSVVFSRRGERLLSTSYDGTARLWNAATGELLGTLEGHNWWVWSAAFSPDETELVTASQDGTAVVWPLEEALRQKSASAESHQAPRTFRQHQGAVYAVAVSPQGRQVATGGYDKRILLWKAGDVQPLSLEKLLVQKSDQSVAFTELSGHTAAVHALAFSPDGRRLVSGAFDNALNVWDVETGQLIKSLRGHAGQVRSCRFSPDGKKVLSGGHDGQVKVWNVDTYGESRVLGRHVLQGHSDALLGAAFSPDGRQIVTASRDRTAKVWDAASGLESKTLDEGHAFLASTAIFFPDGSKLLTAAVDGTTRVWDAAAGTELWRLSDTGRSAAAAISADGQWILTGSSAKTARLWDAAGKPIRELPAHRTEVTAVAISPDRRWLFTGESSGRVNLWRAETGELAWSQYQHSAKITAASFTPDDGRLLTASIDRSVGQWDLATGQELTKLVLKHPGGVTSLALLPPGRAVTTCEDNQVRLWDLATAQVVESLTFGGAKGAEIGINAVAVDAAGKRLLAVNSTDRVVHLWDVEANRELHRPGAANRPFLEAQDIGPLLWSAGFSPDGKRVATLGGSDARLWDAASGELERTLARHGAVASARFSPDGRRVITGSWDNSAKIWNMASGLAELKLAGRHAGHVNSATFSPDGRWALTASDDKTAWLWNAVTGEPIRLFKGHQDRVTQAVFSPDGTKVLTASADKTARLWTAATGEELRKFTGHDGGLLWAEFSFDGTRIITAAADNEAKIWDSAGGEALMTLSGHTAGVNSATLSRDNRRALTGSQDNSVKLWDALTGKEILSLKEHTQEVTSVAFSPDGRSVLSASRDGAAILRPALDWKPVLDEERSQ